MTRSLGSPSGANLWLGPFGPLEFACRIFWVLNPKGKYQSHVVRNIVKSSAKTQLTMFKTNSKGRENWIVCDGGTERRGIAHTRSWIIAHPHNIGRKKKRKSDERLKFFCCQPCQSVASHPSWGGAGVATTGILQPIFTSHLKPILTNPNPWIFFSFTSRWFRVSCLLRIF